MKSFKGFRDTRLYWVSNNLIVFSVSRVSSVFRGSTVTMLLLDLITGLNWPLYYFSGFQEFREFLMFEGFQRLKRYTLVKGFRILGILERLHCFTSFEGIKGFNAFVGF